MHSQRPGPPIGDQVVAELAARRLHRDVDLAGGHRKPLGDQLEVVDQRLHGLSHDLADVLQRVAHPVGAAGQLGRPCDLGVRHHHRAGLQLVQALRHDPE